MWLSKQTRHQSRDEEVSQGQVTIGGASAGVMAGCEYRDARVFGPKGMIWRPEPGDTALVIKGSTPAVAGVLVEDGDLEPGELMLCGKGCSVKLTAAGQVCITGEVYINGSRIGEKNGA